VKNTYLVPAAAALLFCVLTLPGAAQEQPAPRAPAQLTPEQAELSKITTENQLADQKLKKKLQQLNSDKEELKAQYDLELQKQRAKTAELEAELARTASENKLAEEKRKAEIAKLETEYQKLSAQNRLSGEQARALSSAQGDELGRLTLENKLAEERAKKLMTDLALRMTTLKAENDLKAEQQRMDLIADAKERNALDLGMKRLDLEERKLKIDKLALDSRLNKINSDLDLRTRKEEWKKESNSDPVYSDKPFTNGKLVISDRRISLDGPIISGVGDYVTDNVNYFNNISTQPIFIVIDNSPGGSVMEGQRILKAMQSSKAPIYVVVKSFAASMAAAITTLADRSYAYPNAVILHHQMSSGIWGNMTQMKEQLELAREWDRRVNIPVAKKMGISLDEFRKKMYEKNSDGDWQEFGDKAVELKWVDQVADKIEETGITKNPEEAPPARTSGRMRKFELEEKTDEKGQRYISLPRLQPFDFYFIHNPDRYYR